MKYFIKEVSKILRFGCKEKSYCPGIRKFSGQKVSIINWLSEISFYGQLWIFLNALKKLNDSRLAGSK